MSEPDPRYPHEDLRPTSISVAKLDELMAFVMQSGTGVIGAVIGGIKILVVVAYVFARERLLAQEAQYRKQEYERRRTGGNQGELDRDDLGGARRT